MIIFQVNDRATELELLYIDDLVEEMLDALEVQLQKWKPGQLYCRLRS